MLTIITIWVMLRALARHNEASALKNAREQERKKWQDVIADKESLIADKDALIADREAAIEKKDALIADLLARLGENSQ